MGGHPVLFGAIAFGLGVALQAILMLQGRFRPGDWKRAVRAALMGLLGMIPSCDEHSYSPPAHLLFSFTVVAVMFALFFRGRLVPRVGGRLLLAWNILLVFVIAHPGGGTLALLILIAIPTLLTVLNAFTDIDREFGWQVFFHAWFSTILAVIAIVGFDASSLRIFLRNSGTISASPPLEMLVAGAAWLYIVASAWFVAALIPIPLYKGQPWSERRGQVRRHMKLLAYGYAWEKDDLLRSLVVLLGLPLVLLASARWGEGTWRTLVPLAIALMPLLAGRAPVASGDGVGELPPEAGARPKGPRQKKRPRAAR